MSDFSLFNELTAEDQEKIEGYITRFSYGSSCNRAPLEKVLRNWADAKSPFYHMFGDKFIVSKQIVIKKDENLQLRSIQDMFSIFDHDGKYISSDTTIYEFTHNWYEMIDKNYHDNPIIMNALEGLLNNQTLLKNEYNGETIAIRLPNDKIYKLQDGCKAMRAINKIATAYNIPNFEYFCNKHSQALNDKYLEGTLNLSIHPLDFMTMSDNDCDWSSCMSWKHEGGYRQGTVEMMNSPCVICAYLDSATPMNLYSEKKDNPVEWHNKKWRELIICDPNVIIGVKGYPYSNKLLEREVLSWVKSFAEKYYQVSYFDTLYDYAGEDDHIYTEDKVEHEFCFTTEMMYNDFGCGHSCYINQKHHGYTEINYSGISQCVWCGEEFDRVGYDDYEDYEATVVCPACEELERCCHCDGHYREDEGVWVDGDFFCSDCYDECFLIDMLDGETYWADDMMKVELISSSKGCSGYISGHINCDNEKQLKERLVEYFGEDRNLLYKFHKPWDNYPCYGLDCDKMTYEEVSDLFKNYYLWGISIEEIKSDLNIGITDLQLV